MFIIIYHPIDKSISIKYFSLEQFQNDPNFNPFYNSFAILCIKQQTSNGFHISNTFFSRLQASRTRVSGSASRTKEPVQETKNLQFKKQKDVSAILGRALFRLILVLNKRFFLQKRSWREYSTHDV